MSSSGGRGGGRADDHAAGEAVRLAELADDAAQARPLLARLDLARDADVVDRRHEHEEPAGHRHVRGEPGALRAERLLDHLDEDLLPLAQQLLDLRPAAARRALRARRRPPSPPPPRPRRPDSRRSNSSSVSTTSADVEEAVALEADVDEGGLHAGQDLRHPSLVDVADDAALALALDEDLGDQVVLEDGHLRLVAVRGDDHLLGHHEPLHGARAAGTAGHGGASEAGAPRPVLSCRILVRPCTRP